MDSMYWDSKKQLGIAEDEERTYISLIFNLDAWEREVEGDGISLYLERQIEAKELDVESKNFLNRLRDSHKIPHWTQDDGIERLFDKYQFRPWLNEEA